MIVIGSVRSSGATTLALTLAGWLPNAVLVEADPSGGVLAIRYGLAREPGLTTFAAARDDRQQLPQHCQQLPGGLRVLAAPETPRGAAHLLGTSAAQLATVLSDVSDVIVADIGRVHSSSPSLPFVRKGTHTLIVCRPKADELIAASDVLDFLRDISACPALVLCGPGPYSSAEVAGALGCSVAAEIPDDVRAARLLSEGGRASTLARTPLVRAVRTLADSLSVDSAAPDQLVLQDGRR